MTGAPKVDDIDEEDNLLTTKIRLTKNEYYATIRNKLEYNRLQVIRRHLTDQCDLNACKIRTSIHDLRKDLTESKRVACHSAEFFHQRNVQSANPRLCSRETGTRSSFARLTNNRTPSRAKSASTLSRPRTAPLQKVSDFLVERDETESDDEIVPISISRTTSAKRSIHRPNSMVSTSITPSETPNAPVSEIPEFTSHRITWPVTLKMFGLQDENEARKELLAWKAEQRKLKVRRPSKTFFDVELERQYQESIRRRQEIEAYATPELIKEHKLNDPIFAKRYRQLKLAIRAGKIPVYDPHDRHIHVTMTKSKIDRARSAMLTAQENQIQTFYREKQTHNDTQLSKRVEAFIVKLKKFKEEQNQ